MEEIIKEQIEYVFEMINETNNEFIKASLYKIKDALSKLSDSLRVDNNIDLAKERLNKIINFIKDITINIGEIDGPTDEDTIDGLNILESSLRQCLNEKKL